MALDQLADPAHVAVAEVRGQQQAGQLTIVGGLQRAQDRRAEQSERHVAPRRLARARRLDVEAVVKHLERHAELGAERRDRPAHVRLAAAQHGSQLAAQPEQRRRLPLHDREVVLGAQLDVERPLDVEHLAARQVRDRATRHAVGPPAQLGRLETREREARNAAQQRRLDAVGDVSRRRVPAHLRLIDHVVMQQRGDLQQLDDRPGPHHLQRVRVAQRSAVRDEPRAEPLAGPLHEAGDDRLKLRPQAPGQRADPLGDPLCEGDGIERERSRLLRGRVTQKAPITIAGPCWVSDLISSVAFRTELRTVGLFMYLVTSALLIPFTALSCDLPRL